MSEPTALRVFLSSTKQDLVEHRKAVSEALRHMGHHPIEMETFGARSESSVTECKNLVASCHVLVVVVAHRYGWVPDLSTGLSITRMEVEHALDRDIPVLGFLVDEAHPWPPQHTESAALGNPNANVVDVQQKVHALAEFKAWLRTRVIDHFTTPDNLATAVSTAVSVQASKLRPAPEPAPDLLDFGPGDLDQYRRVLYDELDQLPSVFRRGARALSEVYVEVTLAGSLAKDPHAPFARHQDFEGHHLGGRKRLGDVVALTTHRRWVLLGDPGSGKTTLMQHLGLELLATADGPVPIWLRIAQLRGNQGLAQVLADRYGEDLARAVLLQAQAGRVVLMLDGLDEHPSTDAARRVVSRLAADVGDDNPVVVSSRPIGYRRPSARFADLHLCPLDDEAQVRLLGHWLTDQTQVATTLATMRARPRLRRMVENPLLLTFVGLVVDGGDAIPSRRSALYRLAVQHLLKGAGRPEATRRLRMSPTAQEALGHLALELHGQDRWLTPESDMLRVLDASGEVADRLRDTWPGLDGFLKEVAQTTGLLVPFPSLQQLDGYTFPHRSLREFLAAKALEADIGRHGIGAVPLRYLEQALTSPPPGLWARLWAAWFGRRQQTAPTPQTHTRGELPPSPGKLGQALAQAAQQPATWAEVLSLTCGLLGEGASDQLVRRVAAEGNPELVARVVGEAEAIASDTVAVALGVQQGQKAWEQRRDLLQQLPALVGDAEVVMALLDRFATITTHGADLWWVQHLLRGISEGTCGYLEVSADVEREAAQRASLLWSRHRPAERATLLAELEPLWRPIPEGHFLMGGPADEEGRFDHEGPQRRVEVLQGFDMLSVPVTNRMYEHFDPEHRIERAYDSGEHPVDNVTWYEGAAFAAWLGLRLPTEVEWVYACRAGTTTRFWLGDQDKDLFRGGWVGPNSGGQTHPVAQLDANPWGLHDMHGNVWEWCLDGARNYEASTVTHDPTTVASWVDPGDRRVIRGGPFDVSPLMARSADRYGRHPRNRVSRLGIRLARAPAPRP